VRQHVEKGLRDILPFAGWTRSQFASNALWMMIVGDESGNEVASERATVRQLAEAIVLPTRSSRAVSVRTKFGFDWRLAAVRMVKPLPPVQLQTCTVGRSGSDIAISPGMTASPSPKVPLTNTFNRPTRPDQMPADVAVS
jgi:hypothetical protein